MTESEKMTMELLKEMEYMEPKTIESFRKEWFSRPAEDNHRNESIDKYINVLCNVAMERALKRNEVA